MGFTIRVENYRCFTEESPLEIEIKEGFTAFLGINNSGKSTILKFFYEFRHLFQLLTETNPLLTLVGGGGINFNLAGTVKDPQSIFSNKNENDIRITFKFSKPPRDENLERLNQLIITCQRANPNVAKGLFFISGRQYTVTQGNPQLQHDRKLNVSGRAISDFNELIESMEILFNTLYIGPFRNVINTGTNDSYYDIQVGQSFVTKWRDLKTGPQRQENEHAYNLTQEIKRIFNFDELEINPTSQDETLQIFINGRSYSLSELGAGIAQFIMVLANAAVKKPRIILIDEPELNLHPSLQIDFLTTLASYSNHSVIFCTHSVGLARATAETIYSVRMETQSKSIVKKYEETPSPSEFLGELSFSEYRELGFDKVLLVEGVTEVKAIQQFLRVLKKEHEVLILPLGGNQLINDKTEYQLEEIKRVSPNIYALVDSEKPSKDAQLPNDRRKFKELCDKMDIECHVLDRRATENYLTTDAIQKVKGSKYSALGEYDKPPELFWGKENNWKIAREMKKEDWIHTDLGQFLDSIGK